MKLQKVIVGFFLVLFFSTCSNSFLPVEELTDDDSTEIISPVSYDSERGITVLSFKGTEIDIESLDEEEGVNYRCIEPLEYRVFDDTPGSRNVSDSHALKAVIVGRRNDNRPAIWLVFNDGTVSFPYDEKTGHRSSRFKVDEDFDTGDVLGEEFEGSLGWSYFPTVLSNDGMVIGGYAYNETGYSRSFFHERFTMEIAPESRAGVYWFLYQNDEGSYFISRTQVAGLVEYVDSSYGVFKYWFLNLVSKLKLYFLDDLDNYLTDIDSIEADNDVEGLYKLLGPDKDNVDSVAVVDRKRVISLENQNVPSENSAPYDIIGPSEAYLPYRWDRVHTILLETNSPDGSLDPDGDFVLFFSSQLPDGASLDSESGIITVINPTYGNYDEQITVWTEDENGLKSDDFVLTLHFRTSS